MYVSGVLWRGLEAYRSDAHSTNALNQNLPLDIPGWNAFCSKGSSSGASAMLQDVVKDGANVISCVVWWHFFSNGTSWLLLCSLLGSSLPSCFGHLICVLPVYQSVAGKPLYKEKSLLAFAMGARSWKTSILVNTWLLDDSGNSLSFSCLDFPFFIFYLVVYTLFARHFEHLAACESILTAT